MAVPFISCLITELTVIRTAVPIIINTDTPRNSMSGKIAA